MLRQSKTILLQPDIDIVYTRWRLDHKRPGCGRYVIMSFLTSLLCRPIQNLVICLSRDTSLLIYRRPRYCHQFPYACHLLRFVVYPYILRFMYFVFYTTPFSSSIRFLREGGAVPVFSALGRFFFSW